MTAAVMPRKLEVDAGNGWRTVSFAPKSKLMKHQDAMVLCGLSPSTRGRWSEDLATLNFPNRIPLTGDRILKLWKLNQFKRSGGSRQQFLDEFANQKQQIDWAKVDRFLVEELKVPLAAMETFLRNQGYRVTPYTVD